MKRWMSVQMAKSIEELNKRLEKIENLKNQELISLVEILTNATFFGELKKANCEFASDGQCGFFTFMEKQKNKLPIISQCIIENCSIPSTHYHLETTNITCSLCNKLTLENSSSKIKSTKNNYLENNRRKSIK
jgi:hypothetical protein